jgi:hypothetical protein
MARRISGVGLVTVSLRKSIKPSSNGIGILQYTRQD